MTAQPHLHLCLVLHNHQPIGNFDGVFEKAYQDSYLPFLDVFQPFEQLRISLHTSGPLMKWLSENHPEYLERVKELVAQGRIEIVGGAFYEPILAMIPSQDRQGQIREYSDWLNKNLGCEVNGMWVPERVWESGFTSDIATAGIRYTILDDYHFRRAGVAEEELNGFFVTENEGQILRVFPGSEKLRYLIPFSEPGETVEYCRQLAQQRSGSVVVFGDDGEKFGTWPDTKQHVYENGWLQRFFEALDENRDWLKTSTLNQAVTETQSRGKVFLPDASYREMTEWALPVQRQIEFDNLTHSVENDGRFQQLKKFIGGGFWRNFKVKYPESDEMYARMMYVSRLLKTAETKNVNQSIIAQARDHLYQGQCNCSYWHGAFGGIYLPHLRNAVYQQLIEAEKLLESELKSSETWVDCTDGDFNFDGQNEVRLANDKLVAWIKPHEGGYLYELDLRNIAHNLLATMQRRPESYHEKIRNHKSDAGAHEHEDAASIHDRVVFKQEGLENCLNYDQHLRKSLVDHFWPADVDVHDVARATATELGDFYNGDFQAAARKNPDRMQVVLKRTGAADGHEIKITKGVTLDKGASQIEVAYLLEGLPKDKSFHFGVEFNFAGLPERQDDRFFSDKDGKAIGQLGSILDMRKTDRISLTDGWLDLQVQLSLEQETDIWTFPIHSVSQSESGFELVHQSVVVQPHWVIKGDSHGRWVTKILLNFDSASTESQPKDDQMVATG